MDRIDFKTGTFYLGDCFEVMASIPRKSIDMVFTPPPYNLGEGMKDKGGLRIGHAKSAWAAGALLGSGYATHADNMPYPEYCEWQRVCISMMWDLLKDDGALFYQHKPRVVKKNLRLPFFVDLPLRQIIIWDRGSGFNHMSAAFKPVCEWVLLYAKDDFKLASKGASTVGDVWRVKPETKNDHPAPFPIELVKMAIEATTCQTILDPFAGSGTTAIAAIQSGRRWTCIERDPGYFEKAIARVWEAEAAL